MITVMNAFSRARSLLTGMAELFRYRGPVLTSGAVIKSEWADAGMFAKLVGSVYADANGTLAIQFSTTGVGEEVDHEDIVPVEAGIPSGGFISDMIQPHVRLVFTNGASNQTTDFRLRAYGRRIS